jgi:amino acid transporter
MSPLLAAAALLVMSFNILFTFNSIAFLISAVLVATAVLPQREKEPEAETISAWEKVSYGTRAYLATPR